MQLPGCKCTDTGILQLSTKSHVSSRFPECTAHPAALIRLWILHTAEHVTSGPRNEGEGEEVHRHDFSHPLIVNISTRFVWKI